MGGESAARNDLLDPCSCEDHAGCQHLKVLAKTPANRLDQVRERLEKAIEILGADESDLVVSLIARALDGVLAIGRNDRG